MSRRARITFPRMDVELADESRLPPRRGQVLRLAAKGLSSKAIANRLGISDQTVSWHLAELQDQLCAHSRVDLISQSWMHGLLRATPLAFVLIVFSALPSVRSRPSPVSGTRPAVTRNIIGRNVVRELRA